MVLGTIYKVVFGILNYTSQLIKIGVWVRCHMKTETFGHILIKKLIFFDQQMLRYKQEHSAKIQIRRPGRGHVKISQKVWSSNFAATRRIFAIFYSKVAREPRD